MNPVPIRTIALATGALLLALAPGVGAEPGATPQAPRAATAARTPAVRGVLTSVSDGRLVLDAGGGAGHGARLFLLDDRTVVQRRVGKPISVRELKPGDAVTVSYAEVGGKAVARRVWVRSPREGAATGSGRAGALRRQ